MHFRYFFFKIWFTYHDKYPQNPAPSNTTQPKFDGENLLWLSFRSDLGKLCKIQQLWNWGGIGILIPDPNPPPNSTQKNKIIKKPIYHVYNINDKYPKTLLFWIDNFNF